jgi:hypothetical protein
MSSSDVDPDARTETLQPVFTGRARPVLLAEDGTRILPGIDTDLTPMAFVARPDRPGPTLEAAVATEPDDVALPLGQRIAAMSVLLLLVACGMLVVAAALALASR